MRRVKILPHICLDAEGLPWIDDTKTRVSDIVELHRQFHWNAEDIFRHQSRKRRLSLDQIHAALEFYRSFKAVMDRQMERERHGSEVRVPAFRAMARKRLAAERPHMLDAERPHFLGALVKTVGLVCLVAPLIVLLWPVVRGPGHLALAEAAQEGAAAPRSPAPVQATVPPPSPPAGPLVEPGHHAATIPYAGNVYDVFFVHYGVDDLRCFYRDEQGRRLGDFGGLREFAQRQSKRLLFATNAGIFCQAGAPPEPVPEGLFIENGRTVTALNEKSGAGNFYLAPNGVFAVTRSGFAIVETSHYADLRDVDQATQSGPLLVIRGAIHPRFNPSSQSRFVRNGVGLIDDRTAALAISTAPVNFDSFARFFLDALHCNNALYLDGSISDMYLPELGRTHEKGDFAGMLGVLTSDD